MLQNTPITNTTTSTTTPVQPADVQTPAVGNYALGGGLLIAIVALMAMYFKNSKTQDQKSAAVISDATAIIKTDIKEIIQENAQVKVENAAVIKDDSSAKKEEIVIQKTVDQGAKVVAKDSTNTNLESITDQINKDWNT